MTRDLLIIFTRNPILGKCKTRLATSIGDQAALRVYSFLLEHTKNITKNLILDKEIHYSSEILENDLWPSAIYGKKLQSGDDLGVRMQNAFKQGFENKYQRIVIIGSDIYDLGQSDIEEAFSRLRGHDYVIGPAMDGGYYLLGMNKMNDTVFRNKKWGSNTVLHETLEDLKSESLYKLKERNDVDVFDDIKDISAFNKIIEDQPYE